MDAAKTDAETEIGVVEARGHGGGNGEWGIEATR